MSTQQPNWEPPQPPKPKPPIYKRWPLWAAVIGSLLLLTIIIISIANVETSPSASVKEPDTTEQSSVTTESTIDPFEGLEDEPGTTEAPSAPPVTTIGKTLVMKDEFGSEIAEVTVGGPTHPSGNRGIRFSTGGEFDTPEHGFYMGVWVKVKALEDGVDTVYGDLHVAQGGQHYPGDACCPDGFKPTLDYATLSNGETSQGWVIFDVRDKHGQIVITDYDGKRIGAWKF